MVDVEGIDYNKPHWQVKTFNSNDFIPVEWIPFSAYEDYGTKIVCKKLIEPEKEKKARQIGITKLEVLK